MPQIINKQPRLLPQTSTNSDIITTPAKINSEAEDRWLNIARHPLRSIDNTPYFLSRIGQARQPQNLEPRFNRHGYDKDNPQDALVKYEATHPISWLEKTWNEITDFLFNLFTVFVPKALSLSAGVEKQRIDQQVVLSVVRDAVDKFPELKIRISNEDFDRLNAEDQMLWHEMMSIIRQAQHDYIANELAQAYPGHIDQNAPIFLYTGGRATGLLRVLYCSVDEYVALYWSDWGLKSTDSGSYKAHVYDYITEGQNINWSANPDNFNPKDHEITEPGEYTFLGRGDRKIWSFEGPCGMVDHGIGDVISMSKFAMVSNFFSTLNMEQVAKLISTQAKAIAHEYAQRIRDITGEVSCEVKNVSQVTQEELSKAQGYFAAIIEKATKLGKLDNTEEKINTHINLNIS